MILTLRKVFSEQSALEAALQAYRELRDRLIAEGDERTRRVAERTFERGAAVLESLIPRASDVELDEGEQALMEMFLTSTHSDDLEQQRMWLGLLPESVDRLFGAHVEERVPMRAVAEEATLYEVVGEPRTVDWRDQHRTVELSRWGHPSAV